MATPFHTIVNLRDIKFAKVNRTFRCSTSLTKADHGKAVSLDTSAANTVKLAADGDHIIGYLEVVEDRGVCTVALAFTEEFTIKNGATVAVGDTVVGGGGGTVRRRESGSPAVSDPDHNINFVVEVAGGKAVVVKT